MNDSTNDDASALRNQLFRYAQELQNLMQEHNELQQRHLKMLQSRGRTFWGSFSNSSADALPTKTHATSAPVARSNSRKSLDEVPLTWRAISTDVVHYFALHLCIRFSFWNFFNRGRFMKKMGFTLLGLAPVATFSIAADAHGDKESKEDSERHRAIAAAHEAAAKCLESGKGDGLLQGTRKSLQRYCPRQVLWAQAPTLMHAAVLTQ
jgi:hypothetical protein